MIPAKIIIHCTDSPNGRPYPAAQINLDHIARGFDKIGYQLVIQPDGSVELGRSFDEVGAHCEGENHDSIGIALVGADRFTEAQFQSLRYQIDSILMSYLTVPKWGISCHYQYKSAQAQGKTCPNVQIANLLYWYYLKDEKAISDHILEAKGPL